MAYFLRWKKKLSLSDLVTWAGLFLLVPFVILGVFAEMSLPGEALYPMKRGIERLVLNIDSLNKSAQALYQIHLASSRFDEANKLLEVNYNPDQLAAFVNQVQDAKLAIEALPAGPQREQARAQLIASITTYQQALAKTQNKIESSLTHSSNSQPVTSPKTSTTSTSVIVTSAQTQSGMKTSAGEESSSGTEPTRTQTATAGNSAVPTAAPDVQDTQQSVNSSIAQTAETLEQIKLSLLAESPTPTPTLTPSSSPEPTEASPSSWDRHTQNDARQGGEKSDAKSDSSSHNKD